MPPRETNTKKESGRAKKAENEAKKKEAAELEKEKLKASEWDDGVKGKSSKAEKEEKKKAEAARKAENARLLAEEEAKVQKAKPKPTDKGKKKGQTPAGPGAIAAGSPPPEPVIESTTSEFEQPETFAATGLDDALELLTIVNAKSDKASVGQAAAGIERHPERRYKAAFEAYQERELPILKEEHPGLRLNQYKDLLHKQFQKAPENPFNQTLVSFDASKEEKVAVLNQHKQKLQERLRE